MSVENGLENLRIELKKLENPAKIAVFKRFFKTGPGEYGYGDRFLGIPVPVLRGFAQRFVDLDLNDLSELLCSEYHEERFVALQILVMQFARAGKKQQKEQQKKIFDFYVRNAERINNWDLVDTSAPQIVGGYLYDKPRDILQEFSRSDNLWKKRIALLSTFYFIRKNDFASTLEMCENLLNDKHDLIHKATGWMLREVGKRDIKKTEDFLDSHAAVMPRTMLRYAIEKFPEAKKKKYMASR